MAEENAAGRPSSVRVVLSQLAKHSQTITSQAGQDAKRCTLYSELIHNGWDKRDNVPKCAPRIGTDNEGALMGKTQRNISSHMLLSSVTESIYRSTATDIIRLALSLNALQRPTVGPCALLSVMISLQWKMYFAGVGGRIILPPMITVGNTNTPPNAFKVVGFHSGSIATSTNDDCPYLTDYPSYHSFPLSIAKPRGHMATKCSTNERNVLAMLRGGSFGSGPYILGSGFGALVFKDACNIKPFEVLRILYNAYETSSTNITEHLKQESKFLVSLLNVPPLSTPPRLLS